MSEKMIKVECLRTIKSGGSWVKPGSRIELDEKTAKALNAITNPSPVIKVLSDVEWAEELIAEGPSEEELKENENREITLEEFSHIEAIDEGVAEAIYGLGITSLEALQAAAVEDLTPIKGVGKKTAQDIIDEANELETE